MAGISGAIRRDAGWVRQELYQPEWETFVTQRHQGVYARGSSCGQVAANSAMAANRQERPMNVAGSNQRVP